jgi:hypothetical protein
LATMMVGVFVLALMGEDSMELSRFRAAPVLV